MFVSFLICQLLRCYGQFVHSFKRDYFLIIKGISEYPLISLESWYNLWIHEDSVLMFGIDRLSGLVSYLISGPRISGKIICIRRAIRIFTIRHLQIWHPIGYQIHYPVGYTVFGLSPRPDIRLIWYPSLVNIQDISYVYGILDLEQGSKFFSDQDPVWT
mgnify:CR=1 FL=1